MNTNLNFLHSDRTEKGFPLQIEATKIEYEESPFDVEFVKSIIPKIDYSILLFGIQQIADKCENNVSDRIVIPDLPTSIEMNDGIDIDEDLLRKLHTVLFDIHVVEGDLICPDTGRRFNIKMGIPNMILHADEI
jgi:multifunctional methyltransferase subunit TRM112